jgi:hypothetical protein
MSREPTPGMSARGSHRPARRVVSALLAIAAAISMPLASALAVSSSYTISGFETSATSTQGTFAGTASGSGDTAAWRAVVKHTVLDTDARITGGYAALYTSDLVTIRGKFGGGSVTQVDGFTGCGDQHYDVVGNLVNVTRSDRAGSGTGTFTATLTHHRQSFFGSCVVYWASVSGSIQLSFG